MCLSGTASRACNRFCRMPAEGPCTRHQIGGRIQTSARSGILLSVVRGKEKLSEGKEFKTKNHKINDSLRAVGSNILTASQTSLALE